MWDFDILETNLLSDRKSYIKDSYFFTLETELVEPVGLIHSSEKNLNSSAYLRTSVQEEPFVIPSFFKFG